MYDYNKLQGRIKEMLKTQMKYAEALNISATSINNKLNNRTPFTQEEISESVKILNISNKDIQKYFFTKKVEKISTKN